MTGRVPAWPTALWLGLILLAGGSPLSAQQVPPARDTADARDAATPARVDPPSGAETANADTLSLRERVLQRLRALPTTPFTAPDTTEADSAQIVIAGPGEEAAADTTEAADSVPRGVLPDIPPPPADTAAPDARTPERTPDLTPDTVPPDAVRDTLARDTLAQDTLAQDTLTEPGGPLRADSIMEVLQGLEGYTRTDYAGEAAVFEAETNVLRMTGQGRVGREGESLATDSLLVYSGETGVVCGYGNPVLTSPQGEPVESERVCYDIGRDLGMAEGARTTFQQDGTWYVRGPENRVYVLTGRPQNEIYGSDTDFTSCELPEPHYTFNAGSLKMVENDVMVARDVTLRFQDVPVFWLPWLIQSMKDGRRSGLLMPEFGINDIVRTGSSARSIENLGFYWAMNDYVSARGTFGWLSDNWKSLEGAVTYRWLRQFLNGSLSLRHYWRENGRRDLTVGTNNSWQPDERTQVTVAGNYASSTAFVRDNSFSPRELNRSIVMNGSVRRRFDWGSLTGGARRTQRLSDERIEMVLPLLSVTVNAITLYTAPSGTNTLTWSGSGDVNRRTTDVLDTLPGGRDYSIVRAGFNHRLGYGRISLNQNINWTEDRQMFKPALNPAQCFLQQPGAPCVAFDGEGNQIAPDSALPETLRQDLTWSTSTSYQQDLWTGTTLTPRISISGRRLRTDGTDGAFVDEPLRTRIGADLNTSIYGFWPGVGPFSRIRHKISPRLSWSYAPGPGDTSPLQDSIFGVSNLRENNQLELSFNQTFEAKYADADTVPEETVAEEGGGLPAQDPVSDGEPRRLPQARKTTLLSINTSTPFRYDFVARREDGRGFLTDEIRNSIRSDILRGLQLNTTHDLFREEPLEEGAPAGTQPDRTFAPFLTRLTTSFSIDQDFWLFRVLGLSGGPDPDGQSSAREEAAEGTSASVDPDVGAEAEPSRAGRVGSLVPGTRSDPSLARAEVGGWRASLNYTLDRRRPESGLEGSQTLSGNFSFSPTPHWSVNWSTAYSFTDRDFQYHTLRLTRDLHRWQANFDFSKAQNGNFIFRFRVTLLDNPDLEFDYDQHSGTDRSGFRPQP